MARLGNYEYPDVGLLESIELGKKIAREFAGEVSRHGLARSLGMAERGGAFAARIGALRMWGIATGRSRLRVTREGLRAVNPLSPQESESAKRILASQVGLFTEMASRMSGEPYDHARLAVLVEEVTGEDRQAVASKIVSLDRVFSEARPYLLQQARRPQQTATEAPEGVPSATDAPQHVYEEARSAYRTAPNGSFQPAAAAPRRAESSAAAAASAEEHAQDYPRIEIVLPDGRLSLPESVSNLDAALTVLWARRQLLAATDAQQGKPSPKPPREFSGS